MHSGYFNGTPAATVAFALDVIVPMKFGSPANQTIDLIVAGPNEGQNNGPFLYTLSGTIAATYFGVERGVNFTLYAISALLKSSKKDTRYRVFRWE